MNHLFNWNSQIVWYFFSRYTPSASCFRKRLWQSSTGSRRGLFLYMTWWPLWFCPSASPWWPPPSWYCQFTWFGWWWNYHTSYIAGAGYQCPSNTPNVTIHIFVVATDTSFLNVIRIAICRIWQIKTRILLRRWTKPCQILGRTMDRLSSEPTFELETDEQFQHHHKKKQILTEKKKSVIPPTLLMIVSCAVINIASHG